MTYDSWKLETPEDERARHARYWGAPRLRCRHCGTLNNPGEPACRNCDSPDLEDDSGPDPDDAGDAEMDR